MRRGKTCGESLFEENSGEMKFAMELAEILNDRESLPFYISLIKRHPESLLREVLGKVRSVPDHKIRTNRAAYFNFLIQQYARARSYYSRD